MPHTLQPGGLPPTPSSWRTLQRGRAEHSSHAPPQASPPRSAWSPPLPPHSRSPHCARASNPHPSPLTPHPLNLHPNPNPNPNPHPHPNQVAPLRASLALAYVAVHLAALIVLRWFPNVATAPLQPHACHELQPSCTNTQAATMCVCTNALAASGDLPHTSRPYLPGGDAAALELPNVRRAAECIRPEAAQARVAHHQAARHGYTEELRSLTPTLPNPNPT